MNELIKRLQALTGPCREVDAAIAVATSGDPDALVVTPYETSMFSHKPGWWCDGQDKSHAAPAFTASIDSAMTLVPEGHSWMLSVGGGSIAQVTDCTGDACTVPPDYDGMGATPAIALCIAALKATQ